MGTGRPDGEVKAGDVLLSRVTSTGVMEAVVAHPIVMLQLELENPLT